MTTFFMKKQDLKDKKWHVIDAKDQVVGRLASRISRILMGKHKPSYTPHVDSGDGVIAINSAHVRVTGRKNEQKLYKNYSGYPGGLKERTMKKVVDDFGMKEVLRIAIKGMLPKNKLRDRMMKNLLITK